MSKCLHFLLFIQAICIICVPVSALANNEVHVDDLVIRNSIADMPFNLLSTDDPYVEFITLNLDELMSIAFKHNQMLEVVRQKVAQSQGQLTQARSGYMPQLAARGRYFYTERQDSASGSSNSPSQNSIVSDETEEDDILSGAVTFSQLIYDFGKTSGAINVGNSNLAAEDAHLQRQIQSVIFQVKEAYYNVLEKMRLIDVALESVKSFEQHLGIAQVYYKAGARTKIDVINAEVELATARLSLLRSEYNLKTAKIALEKVLGTKPNGGRYELISKHIDLDNILDSMPPIPVTIEESIAEALERRPDIMQLKNIIDASKANVSRTKGDYWPAIVADAKYNEYDTNLSLYKDSWEVGVAATWELFSGFKTHGEVAEATGKLRENQALLQDLQIGVMTEITNSFLKAEENRESVDLALKALGLAKENVQLAGKRYKSGTFDVIEFNDAQLSLTRTQGELVLTYYGYLTAFAGIEYALGRDFSSETTAY